MSDTFKYHVQDVKCCNTCRFCHFRCNDPPYCEFQGGGLCYIDYVAICDKFEKVKESLND